MRDIELSAGVFVRSMADRGHPGGICRAALGTVRVMEALGKDLVIIESVGAGQSDKALFYLCDTVITLFTPEFGDDLQLLKAGLLEIGDIVVINKMDKAGSEDAANAISARMREKMDGQWDVPIFCTRADIGKGITDLAKAIDNRWRFLQGHDQTVVLRTEKTVSFMMTLLKEELWRRFLIVFHKDEACEEIIRNVECKIIDPYVAVAQVADIIDERLQRRQ
jgi:LAO/AO transport system kinase